VEVVKRISDLCGEFSKEMVVYISMGFGNIYNEDWNENIVADWVDKLHTIGVQHFSISDTVGVSHKATISAVFSKLFKSFPEAEFGAHFHTKQSEWKEKVESAYNNGCKRFDGAIKGFGGCPMAKDDLVGNMPTERLIDYFGFDFLKLKKAPFNEAFSIAEQVFSKYQ